ncbi:hypothetical protein E4U56_006577 [Claviceps arundinis]|uniref:GAG-pre-integrase domain-containing protein n=1 Tax=Claviceps arundinis TaxID=1623583 RepID=A0A9P7SQ06_9HYPO|nr:hypothetical protein E4U56_006577 [Claviceps arundinis]
MDGRNDQLDSAGTGLPVGKFKWKSNISTLNLRDERPPFFFNFAAINSAVIAKQVEFGLLHKRLVHAGKDHIVEACKEAGIAIDPRSIINFQCPACLLAKAPRQVHRDESHDSPHSFSRVFWDFIEHKPEGIGGRNYTFHAIDAHTRF